MPLGVEVGLGPGDFVLDGDPALSKKDIPTQFSAHVYRGQTAGWINVPLGTEVGLGQGNVVFDGDPAPSPVQRGTAAPPPCITTDVDGRCCLRSAATSTLFDPSSRRSSLRDRAFPVAASRAWNSLPADVRDSPYLLTFRRRLKTFLFHSSYG